MDGRRRYFAEVLENSVDHLIAVRDVARLEVGCGRTDGYREECRGLAALAAVTLQRIERMKAMVEKEGQNNE